jgi:hypothetical protein
MLWPDRQRINGARRRDSTRVIARSPLVELLQRNDDAG